MAHIMFVDDDPLTLETFARATQLFGHQALLAGSGEEALRLAGAQAPDLIFIDQMLPDMDGLDLLRAFHRQASTSQIPMLVLSAGPEVELAEQARDAGACDFVSKPIRLAMLQEVIQTYTAG